MNYLVPPPFTSYVEFEGGKIWMTHLLKAGATVLPPLFHVFPEPLGKTTEQSAVSTAQSPNVPPPRVCALSAPLLTKTLSSW